MVKSGDREKLIYGSLPYLFACGVCAGVLVDHVELSVEAM